MTEGERKRGGGVKYNVLKGRRVKYNTLNWQLTYKMVVSLIAASDFIGLRLQW